MNKQTLGLALFLLINLQALAQSHDIKGQVIDQKTGVAIENANIQILGTTKATNSGKSGRFYFSGIAPANYQLIVSHVSYLTDTVQVTVDKPLELPLS
ncbi:MAG: carboxypeptidase regulatory-like domain-containing protein [Bacteroidia bacterium]